MNVFVFDLLPYKEHLDHLKVDGELPWPLAKRYFNPKAAVETYREHLDVWAELEPLGYDGVVFNEHHTSPYGLMNSPNLMAAALSQRTERLKIAIYGNLLPLHNPLRLAEELAMLDCLTNGRLICGLARGIPREYDVYNINPQESRARFEEAWEILQGVWTQEVFSFEGRFWQFRNVAIWPRPVQQPHPQVWIPVTSSKESIEWAARHNFPITPGLTNHPGVREDVIRYYAQCLEANGYRITPDHLIVSFDVYLADSKEQAFREAGPYWYYFYTTLFSHGNITDTSIQAQMRYLSSSAHDYLRPEHRPLVAFARESYRGLTMEQLRRRVEEMPWGRPDEVRDYILRVVQQTGANTILLNMNRGALPAELFANQVRRFAAEVLPALKAHRVESVPAVDQPSGR
ncbi:MAG: LLM class flavin-dependent oxidoreductase [Firmicutes bacterium]|nr:LLM class flavin-dependent oxidoreductase [Alicyclobacillaceae bacterium]MCL6498176.1 LLM class flavin-dependent oxidoreductase [Bacillota bacterium]